MTQQQAEIASIDDNLIEDEHHHHHHDGCCDHTHEPIRRDMAKIGRNDPCPCMSGKKYKKCCLK